MGRQKDYSPGKEMIHSGSMGKGCISIMTIMAMVALMLFSMHQPVSLATPPIPTANVESVVLENQYRLVVTIGPWSQNDIRLSDLGIIIVPPSPGSPEENGEAKHLKLGLALNISFASNVRLSYEDVSIWGIASEGDKIIIESIGTDGLPQGQWQLYLIEESTSGSILGITWTVGNEPFSDYQVPFARSSITDPIQHFGLSNQGSTEWAFVVIIGSEIVLLAVIIYLVSRTK
jgi:hypothetical protein